MNEPDEPCPTCVEAARALGYRGWLLHADGVRLVACPTCNAASTEPLPLFTSLFEPLRAAFLCCDPTPRH